MTVVVAEKPRFEEKPRLALRTTGWIPPSSIFALNSSPRKERGATDKVLQAFLEGARSEGAATETVYLQGKDIRPCLGCFSCWIKTPGKCVQDDEAEPLLTKIQRADMLVYATPLYDFTMTATMKAMIERMLPLLEPYLVEGPDGNTIHELRSRKMQPSVLISVCGYPEISNFDVLRATFRKICQPSYRPLVAEILRTMSTILLSKEFSFLNERIEEYLSHVRKAGQEVVLNGSIFPTTQAKLEEDLMPPDLYRRGANEWFKRRIGKLSGLSSS